MSGLGPPWVSVEGSRDRLHGTRRYDVAIVGAGLTGLSTAVHLLELDPNRRVAVIEADKVAAGASGRGTGLLAPRIGPALRTARLRHGDDAARSAYLWSVSAVQHVLGLADRHRIACDLVPGSQLVVASGPGEADEQEQEERAARALGLDIALVPGEELPPVASRYVSGLRYAPSATLDPAALTSHLARIGEQRGLTIYERSPVHDVRLGLRATLTTGDGAVVANHVVMATNAFGFPGSPAGIVGVRVQAGVTEKLSDSMLAAVASLAGEPVIGHGTLSPYFRLTSDGRLVVGGGAILRGIHGSAASLPGRLRAAVAGLSEVLRDVRLEATWAGPIAVTRDGLPVTGRHPDDPNVYYASGCNGHGLASSVYTGAQLAAWIVEGRDATPEPALPWMRSRPPWVPRGRVANRVLDGYLKHLTSACA